MTGKTITRADLAEAVYQSMGLSRTESAQLVERILDLLRDIIPRFSLMISRLQIIVHILKVKRHIAAPLGHRFGLEDLQTPQAELTHPIGLPLHVGNLVDDVGVEPLASLKDGLRLSDEIVLVDFANLVFGSRSRYVGSHDSCFSFHHRQRTRAGRQMKELS